MQLDDLPNTSTFTRMSTSTTTATTATRSTISSDTANMMNVSVPLSPDVVSNVAEVTGMPAATSSRHRAPPRRKVVVTVSPDASFSYGDPAGTLV
jgi:hypothetical protein